LSPNFLQATDVAHLIQVALTPKVIEEHWLPVDDAGVLQPAALAEAIA